MWSDAKAKVSRSMRAAWNTPKVVGAGHWVSWTGPGLVVACHGSTVFAAMRARLWKCAIEQIRPASITEQLGAIVIDRAGFLELLQQARGGRRTEAVDISREGPPPPEEAPFAEAAEARPSPSASTEEDAGPPSSSLTRMERAAPPHPGEEEPPRRRPRLRTIDEESPSHWRPEPELGPSAPASVLPSPVSAGAIGRLTSRAGPQSLPGGEEPGDASAGATRADSEFPYDPVGLRQAERLEHRQALLDLERLALCLRDFQTPVEELVELIDRFRRPTGKPRSRSPQMRAENRTVRVLHRLADAVDASDKLPVQRDLAAKAVAVGGRRVLFLAAERIAWSPAGVSRYSDGERGDAAAVALSA